MQLTSEQIKILNSTGNIKINAIAGSGKTTTIVEYAKTRPANSKILYLAFNRTVRQEAERKFAAANLPNVYVATAHSLAYRYVIQKNNYKVRDKEYSTFEIVQLLGLKSSGEKHIEYIIASHIAKFISYFCNSNKTKVNELDYRKVISDSKAKFIVEQNYHYIEKQVRVMLAMMNSGKIDITHDFYLKKFQLSQPKLAYDYILFDEGQDASEAMLDVFLRQNAAKIIVGDTCQQIYSWRFAVNSLENTPFKNFNLSRSFRFGKEISQLAKAVIDWKKYINYPTNITIKGSNNKISIKTKAVLARTNLGLLLKAIEVVTTKPHIQKIYFEGNINSYTYADNGTSLYDVLNLHNGNRNQIRDKLIKNMRNVEDLKDFVKSTEDFQLALLIEIVEKYGNAIHNILAQIKERHIEDGQRHKADMIFSTVHRAKGMEYDAVQLANDFISEEILLESANDKSTNELTNTKLNEEINLLYVAITRARHSIHIPETLLPKGINNSKVIHRMRVAEDETDAAKYKIKPSSESKGHNIDKIRQIHKTAYKPWTQELDDELELLYCEGKKVSELATHFGRTSGAIRSRIKKLELNEKYDVQLNSNQTGNSSKTLNEQIKLCKHCFTPIPQQRLEAIPGIDICISCKEKLERGEQIVTSDTGICERCGADMVWRYAKKTGTTRYFLGCSKYPKCRFTVWPDK
jgi:superfamily I DNA/RNA helicase/predicted RNA-binding Zn-ribbon protein involved in translation (DUF1610 family)